MKVSIIIPFYNKWELVHARLAEMYRILAKEDVEICLVNDCSTDTSIESGIAFWQKGVDNIPILYKRNGINLGFGGSHNAGSKIATGDIFVFYSNDVVLSGNFIPDLLAAFGREDKDKMLVGNRLIYWPGGWNEFEIDGKKRVMPYIEGFFVACTRTAWKELGGWDTNYGKFDYEDVDLSTNALSLGYNLVDLRSPFLRHLGGQTISSLNVNREEHTRKNREIYIQKWKEFLSKE